MTSHVTALIRILVLLILLAGSEVIAAERKQWEKLTDCRYVMKDYNDGDSFRVKCGKRDFVLRLYYIDAPETTLSNAERAREQRDYFGITLDDVLTVGTEAKKKVHELLQESFVVSTRWAGAAGRSAEPRYFGLVEVGGKSLIEILVSEGMARPKGRIVNLPSGEKSKGYVEKLRSLESDAKKQRKGAWAKSTKKNTERNLK